MIIVILIHLLIVIIIYQYLMDITLIQQQDIMKNVIQLVKNVMN